MILNWKVSKKDHELILAIAERAALKMPRGAGLGKHHVMMDLTACHANGNPLDLAALLAADELNFAHDVFGILRHLDRQTGQLTDCFVPRFSAVEAK